MCWEQDLPRFRAYFWDKANMISDEYEISEADVGEVLDWVRGHASSNSLTYTLYVKASGGVMGEGLIRLEGVMGDPFE
jgi:hypothetical protein